MDIKEDFCNRPCAFESIPIYLDNLSQVYRKWLIRLNVSHFVHDEIWSLKLSL